MDSIPKESELKVKTPKPRGAQTSLSTYHERHGSSSAYKATTSYDQRSKICRIARPETYQMLIIHAKKNKPANQYLVNARSTLDHSKQASRNVQYAIRK
jgi:hypothetical protein